MVDLQTTPFVAPGFPEFFIHIFPQTLIWKKNYLIFSPIAEGAFAAVSRYQLILEAMQYRQRRLTTGHKHIPTNDCKFRSSEREAAVEHEPASDPTNPSRNINT